MASYNHFVTDPYAVLTIQLTMLFIYSGLPHFFVLLSVSAPLREKRVIESV